MRLSILAFDGNLVRPLADFHRGSPAPRPAGRQVPRPELNARVIAPFLRAGRVGRRGGCRSRLVSRIPGVVDDRGLLPELRGGAFVAADALPAAARRAAFGKRSGRSCRLWGVSPTGGWHLRAEEDVFAPPISRQRKGSKDGNRVDRSRPRRGISIDAPGHLSAHARRGGPVSIARLQADRALLRQPAPGRAVLPAPSPLSGAGRALRRSFRLYSGRQEHCPRAHIVGNFIAAIR